MRRFLLLSLSALLTGAMLCAADVPGLENPRVSDVRVMRKKLANVQVIVEGLVQKDFDAIESAGDKLFRLCKGQGWTTQKDSRYDGYRAELQREAGRLVELARAKNLEGTTYAYVKLISTCVDCHAHCRDVLQIAKEVPVLHPVPEPLDGAASATNPPN
jgi:hypothetical protein